ncbi:MAG TPA: hypothetical protein VF614_03350 [Chthoniobacteraceae bacterium]|jgi:hypothetical protein
MITKVKPPKPNEWWKVSEVDLYCLEASLNARVAARAAQELADRRWASRQRLPVFQERDPAPRPPQTLRLLDRVVAWLFRLLFSQPQSN